MLSDGLESVSGETLRALFFRASGRRLSLVGAGALSAAVIQSSGAVTVMTLGFVNAGIVTLPQAAAVIYGANLGTTVTGQLVALGLLGGGGLSAALLFSALTGAGAFLTALGRRDSGGIIAGFGLLFVGLDIMSGAMEDFARSAAVLWALRALKDPLLLLALGVVLTGLVQSSSAVTSLAITMLSTGLLTLDQGIYLTVGSNIGACSTALLAGISGGTGARRAALLHLLFNAGGALLFMLLEVLLRGVSQGALGLGGVLQRLLPAAPQTQLAMFHTVFNAVTVAAALPLTDWLTALVCRAVPERGACPQPF